MNAAVAMINRIGNIFARGSLDESDKIEYKEHEYGLPFKHS